MRLEVHLKLGEGVLGQVFHLLADNGERLPAAATYSASVAMSRARVTVGRIFSASMLARAVLTSANRRALDLGERLFLVGERGKRAHP